MTYITDYPHAFCYNTYYMRTVTRITIVTLFLALTTPFFVHAQDDTIQCQTPEQKIQCQAALDAVNAQYDQAKRDLATAQSKSASLSGDIAILAAKIKAAQLDIKAKNLLIQTLGNNITEKQSHINDLEGSIAQGRSTLSAILRKTNEIDAYSFPEVVLSQSSLTSFFKDVDTFQAVQDGLKSTFEQLRSDEASTSAEKDALTVRQNTEIDARHIIQQEQVNIQSDQNQEQQLLAISKGNEKAYSTLAAEKAAQAAKIRAALFNLAGGSNPIPFGQALQYAQAASAKTGVDPAFLLAILTNESALGANVGKCYVSDTTTGSGLNVSTGLVATNVMKPGRDIPPFLDITKALGFDPYKTVVSCQQPSVGGWGGAMGPAQFIASTWALFEDRLKSALGISTMPNPWNPPDAFMASALYLSDLGASGGGYTAERNAACKYYSGSSCSKSRAIASYGNNAIEQANVIQGKINQL